MLSFCISHADSFSPRIPHRFSYRVVSDHCQSRDRIIANYGNLQYPGLATKLVYLMSNWATATVGGPPICGYWQFPHMPGLANSWQMERLRGWQFPDMLNW